MQFMDALAYRNRLRGAQLPTSWCRVEICCPACHRPFVALASPREDPDEGRLTARRRLLRTCPQHGRAFRV